MPSVAKDRQQSFTIAAYRRWVQLASLVALHSSWGPELKWLCNPVLSCHSCALAWFACPIGVFVHYAGYHLFPFLALGTVLLLGIAIGRLLCGWMCPFGLLQDLLHKIPGPKLELPAWTARIKYAVLAATVLLLPFLLGEQTVFSFCRFCPASALQVTLPNLARTGLGAVDAGMAIKLGILVLVLGAAVVSSRSFCKVLCPIGALLAPLNHLSFWRIPVPTQNCVSCGKCDRACPQGMHPESRIALGIPPNRAGECIVCYECRTICPRPRAPRCDRGNAAS